MTASVFPFVAPPARSGRPMAAPTTAVGAIRVEIGGYRYCVSPIINNSNKQKTEATE